MHLKQCDVTMYNAYAVMAGVLSGCLSSEDSCMSPCRYCNSSGKSLTTSAADNEQILFAVANRWSGKALDFQSRSVVLAMRYCFECFRN